jgi:hypothetical protein
MPESTQWWRGDLAAPQVLREYALLADGERGILVGPHGDFAWMCAPRWDSPAVFASLIGGGGSYTVTPVGRYVWGGAYERNSLIWRSRWVTDQGIVECREALAFPGDPHRAIVLRRVTKAENRVRLGVLLDARAGFGAARLRDLRRDDDGVWTGRAGDLHLRWSGAAEARPDEDAPGRLLMELEVDPGQDVDLVLEISDLPLDDPPPDPGRSWEATEAAWARTVPDLRDAVAPRDSCQSYAVLRGLTGSAGGTVAAATTSLPERAEEGRNYDYRYVWMRDQCMIGQAMAAAGPLDLLQDQVRFVTARLREHGPDLAPAYTVDGGTIPGPHPLDLPGYPGGSNIVGNQVADQFQLDVFGEVLLLLAAAARHDMLDAEGWKGALTAASAIEQRWREPDSGVWELSPRRWAHSRLICAAGLRAMAGAGASPAQSGQWSALADTLVAATDSGCLHPSGRWQRSPEDPGLDAALLLPPLRGALPASDPRTVETLRAFARELTTDHFAYRFRHDDRPLGEAEGAFVLCGFVMALAEHQQGNDEDAYRWFERNRAACGPAGLFSEEYDVAQRQMRGNLPQAFVHGMLLESAVRLGRPWTRDNHD